MRTALVVAALFALFAGEASAARHARTKIDPRIVGLGRSCKKRVDCKGRGQVCLKESDARGKQLPRGFCALPCTPLDMRPSTPQPPARTGGRGGALSNAAPDAGPTPRERPSPSTGSTGTEPKRPATAEEIRAATKRKPASRCPAKFECRSAGAGVPIDLCVKE